MDHNKSANLIIAKLIVDLTEDNSTHENLERIKKKLNEVLIKYKQKVDFKNKFKMEQELMAEKKRLRDEYERMRDELENKRCESPSILDTGVEHDSPEKRIRPSVTQKDFADFTKEYRLCDKRVYDQNILTKVCPQETEKTIVVDLERIVCDMNMIKNSLSASARQLGFNLVEPHKIEEEEYQEQRNPNIPEPVYTVSQQYRHILNTFLRFSRDIIVNLKGEENSRCFKEEGEKEHKQKQQIMGYQLQISDLKDKLKKSERGLKLLQGIYQNHLESRLQIIDIDNYDYSRMNDNTKECVELIKQTHHKLMELQTIFLLNEDDMKDINKACDIYMKEHQTDENNASFTNVELDASYPQEKYNQMQRRTFHHKSRNGQHEFGARSSTEALNLTAQLPRPSHTSGSKTSRNGFISPKMNKTIEGRDRGSTVATKTGYLLGSENILSTAKPPKFKRDGKTAHTPSDSVSFRPSEYLRDYERASRNHANIPNKSLERRNSFDRFEMHPIQQRTKLASTQSLHNLSEFIEPHTFRESTDPLTKVQSTMNAKFDSFINSKLSR